MFYRQHNFFFKQEKIIKLSRELHLCIERHILRFSKMAKASDENWTASQHRATTSAVTKAAAAEAGPAHTTLLLTPALSSKTASHFE